MKRATLCLFIIMLLLSSCNNSEQPPYESMVSTEKSLTDVPLPVKTPPDSVGNFTLDNERFVLSVNQNPQSYSSYDSYQYAKYDDMYVISLVRDAQRTVHVYMLYADSYGLWIKNDLYTPYIKQKDVQLSKDEVRKLFYSDLSENSVSIASICGAFGTDSSETVKRFCDHSFPGPAVPGGRKTTEKTYKVYTYNGLYCLIDPENGLCDYLLRQHPNEVTDLKRDCILRITRYYTEDDVGVDHFWNNITHDNQKPDITP